MRPSKLSADAVATKARSIPEWTLNGDTIERQFTFTDFLRAMAFVNRIAEAAQSMDHHPDIDIRYNKVKLALSTHDAGGLTDHDFTLAAQCDALA